MAREKAADRRARIDAENSEATNRIWDEFLESYGPRLALLVYRVMSSNGDLNVTLDKHEFVFHSHADNRSWKLEIRPLEKYDWNLSESLNLLENRIESEQEEIRIARARMHRRSALLANMTAEDRELLGL